MVLKKLAKIKAMISYIMDLPPEELFAKNSKYGKDFNPSSARCIPV